MHRTPEIPVTTGFTAPPTTVVVSSSTPEPVTDVTMDSTGGAVTAAPGEDALAVSIGESVAKAVDTRPPGTRESTTCTLNGVESHSEDVLLPGGILGVTGVELDHPFRRVECRCIDGKWLLSDEEGQAFSARRCR